MHVEDRCQGFPCGLLAEPQPRPHSEAYWNWLTFGAPQLTSQRGGLLRRQMGEPEWAAGDIQRRPSEPLSLRVAALGQQGQVDGPAFEVQPVEQRSHSIKI